MNNFAKPLKIVGWILLLVPLVAYVIVSIGLHFDLGLVSGDLIVRFFEMANSLNIISLIGIMILVIVKRMPKKNNNGDSRS